VDCCPLCEESPHNHRPDNAYAEKILFYVKKILKIFKKNSKNMQRIFLKYSKDMLFEVFFFNKSKCSLKTLYNNGKGINGGHSDFFRLA